MKLSIGIVGLPNVGKSTLFKALTKQEITIANYPFATIDPNIGVVTVPDERLQKLAEISHSKKIVPAVVEFYDIAGLVKGANKGEGLGNKFLSHIRETQAIVVVLRVFKNPEIIHVEGAPDPLRDLEIINAELILKDLETIEKRLSSLEAEKKTGDKKAGKNLEVLNKIREELGTGNLATKYAKEEIVHELQLLTAKKQVYLLNGTEFEVPVELLEKIKEIGADYIIADLSSASAIPELIKKSYEVLGLISFLTTGEDETRAWTIEKGTLAPQAAGVIHTDFDKNFIRAEVVNWQKLVEAKGWVQAKQKGLVRVEGKEYEVKDGDVIVVRHG
ncbi:MAG: redox-regulated ATPase YchF [Candidatus Liptonbacteria bacterium]|nr:redox-regulated ATPase YchF [Candidatus Liptonbacteria bacterium]